MEENKLDARKLQILKAVVDEYVQTFEPVGSRTIAKKNNINLSSATIRNEMADLEEMGYLSSPHTSAGRIPSTLGYRTYVDQMIGQVAENPAVAGDIVAKLEGKITEYNMLIKACTQIISEITEYAAIGVAPGKQRFILKAIQLVPVDPTHILIVTVAENNSVKDKVIELKSELDAKKVIELSGIVNNSFSGRPAETISLMMLNEIVDLTGVSRDELLPIVDGIIDCVKEYGNKEVFTSGTSKLLKSPEFDDVQKAREFIDMIQDKEKLENIVGSLSEGNSNVTVSIGTENNENGLSDYSVVSAKYEVDGVTVGTVSVVGPMRMDYQKVISSLEQMRKLLEKKASEENKGDNK